MSLCLKDYLFNQQEDYINLMKVLFIFLALKKENWNYAVNFEIKHFLQESKITFLIVNPCI